METRNKISMALKGRTFSDETRKKLSLAKIGEKNPKAILTEEIVRSIKKDLQNPFYTHLQLAIKYKVEVYNIWNISCGRTWKHIVVNMQTEKPMNEAIPLISADNLDRTC